MCDEKCSGVCRIKKFVDVFFKVYFENFFINDNYPKILITSDRTPNSDFNGIKIINSYDFFIGEKF